MAKKKKQLETSISWNDIRNKIIGLFFALIILFFLLTLQSRLLSDTPVKPVRNLDQKGFGLEKQGMEQNIVFRDGDIIFNQTRGELSERIAAVTGSRLTHCGLIFVEEDKIYVIEASETVRIVPVEKWVQSGVDKKFALLRDGSLTQQQKEQIVREGKRFLERPYDFKFQLDDEEIYCSELVYKAYKNGADIILEHPKRLKDLNYRGHEEYIRSITPGGELKLEREVITPLQIYKSRKLVKIYDDFNESDR
jgi:uncharacterized protein YycO